jgi:crotonobetainyl-CoA:carnitine CoA-transferase CaiB-like acyl-CoA transferase
MPGSTSLADYVSGVYGAVGLLLALRAAEQSGRGQSVDLGLYEGIFRMLDELAPAYARDGFVRTRMGADTVNAVPHSHYPTADGKWVAIAATSDKMFARLAAAMGRPELAAGGPYGKVAAREAAREDVNRLVAEWTGGLPQHEVLSRCAAEEVPSGPINNIADIFRDPQFAARGNLLRVVDDRVGEITIPNVVPLLSRTPGHVTHLGPELGAHNDEIYRGLLGLQAGDLAALRKDGVI